MRNMGFTLAAVLLASPVLRAQAPAANASLDSILANWEAAMKRVNTLQTKVNRTTLEKTFQSTEVFEGTALYMRPNKALLHLIKKGKPDVYERYIFSGQFLYLYVPKEKVIRIYEMPQSKQGQVEDNFLSFLFGMKAADAKLRYDLTLLPAPPNDKWYSYVLIKPKTTTDKRDFSRARLVLSNTTYMPRQLWFEQPTGNEITWDFPQIAAGVQLEPKNFATPELIRGWKFERIRQDAPPRVIRPNQQ